MAFKLGKERGLEANNGEIKTKLSFRRNQQATIPGTPIMSMPLEEGVMGEANMDGTIYISDKLDPNSFQYRQTLNHEMRHATDMKLGKLAYDDNHITYNGERFERQNINGIDSILVDGGWKEAGDTGFPWEDDANNGNK
jgi:hypothetical protein|tara:strand:+ start:52 stop:468 length:417 start_codon:yes stop_codon:yes gene_type:complete